MISSGSKIMIEGIPFTVRGFFGSYVELENEDRVNTQDDYSKNRIYLPIQRMLDYDNIVLSSRLIQHMITSQEENTETDSGDCWS